MKFHNRVLPRLAPSDHSIGIKQQRGVHTSLLINLPLQASPCMHPAQLHNKLEWVEASITHREEIVRAATGGKLMWFWLESSAIFSHVSCHYTSIHPGVWRQDSELLVRWAVGQQRHVEYKHSHCWAIKTCTLHHWGLISTGSASQL